MLGTEKTSDKDTDFNALVTKIKATNPDVIYYGGIYNAGALLSKQPKDGGIKAPLMGGDGLYDPKFIKLAGARRRGRLRDVRRSAASTRLRRRRTSYGHFKAKYPGQEIGRVRRVLL